ncbi:helix-turn-helix transcriptional regulator [Clostridium sp. MB40-C1]|uniref:helix-turn-helix domain-containing protein n=1 Tax=Clostridium sp. MB40-C1 TaxID=3070996 RepID=UPI0027E0E25C|nr:helix-turn-helix transcriptional regulator [Clostridium sp. MB40-C1]WMJ79519.1 helix-turn-helix transcriptional regulator [Clostridium sp. MB40-C1]
MHIAISNLKAVMKEKNISIEELKELTGLSKRKLYSLEQNFMFENIITLGDIDKICTALDCFPEKIITFTRKR